MYEQIIIWAAFVLLLVLCLPLARIQKLVLEVYALALRLALLALLGAAAFLWFFPERLPSEVPDTLNLFPPLRSLLPEPGTPSFGICAAGLVVVVFLPFLAVLDVTRKLAGRRLSRLRALSVAPVVKEPVAPPPAPPEPLPPAPVVQEPLPPPRRADRRTAAATLAAASSRKPLHAVNPEP
jgi:hypothetical protein